MREDVKMFYRPPLLEEPCAQTLSGKKKGPTKHDKTIFKIWTTLNLWNCACRTCKPEGLSPSKFKPSCQATVAPVVSSAQCRASMENRHWRSQAAHRVQKLMLVALVAVVAMDLSNCQAVCLCGTSSHAGHMGRRF